MGTRWRVREGRLCSDLWAHGLHQHFAHVESDPRAWHRDPGWGRKWNKWNMLEPPLRWMSGFSGKRVFFLGGANAFTTVHHSPTAEVRHQRRTEPALRVGWCFRVALEIPVISVALWSCSSVMHFWELRAEIRRWKLRALEGHLCNEQGSATCGKWQNWPVRSPFNIISDHVGIYSGTENYLKQNSWPISKFRSQNWFSGKDFDDFAGRPSWLKNQLIPPRVTSRPQERLAKWKGYKGSSLYAWHQHSGRRVSWSNGAPMGTPIAGWWKNIMTRENP